MKYQRGILLSAFALMGMALVNGSRAQEAQIAPLPAWKSAPKLTRYLSSLVRFNGYAIQPPRGYAMRQMQRPGMATAAWQGSAARNSIAPGLLVAVGPTPQGMARKITAEQLLANALNSQKRGYDDWTQTAVERGRINGLTFARAYWTGTLGQDKRKLRGVSYFAVDGSLMIVLTAQDAGRANDKPTDASTPETQADPNGETSDADNDASLPSDIDRLQLAEAAMQTFRRSGVSVTPSRPAAFAPSNSPAPSIP